MPQIKSFQVDSTIITEEDLGVRVQDYNPEIVTAKNNFVATVVPTTTDDSNADYEVGSRWINLSTNKEYVCVDATASAAVWEPTNNIGINDSADAVAITIDSSEQVGIGNPSPGSILDIQAATGLLQLTSTTGANAAYQTFTNTGGTVRIGIERSFSGGIAIGTTAFAAVINHTAATPLQFGTNNTIQATIDGSGNMGIGEDVPLGKLHVKSAYVGAARSVNAAASDLIIENNSAVGITLISPAASSGFLVFGNPTVNNAGYIKYDHAGNDMTFHTTSGTERVIIDQSGKVGIGESLPLGKLHIKTADEGAVTIDANADELILESGSANCGMTILAGAAATCQIQMGDVSAPSNGRFFYNNPNNYLTIYTNNTEAMKIDSSQNVGIRVTPEPWGTAHDALQIGGNMCLWADHTPGNTSSYWTHNLYWNGSARIYMETAHGTEFRQALGNFYWNTAVSGTAGNTATTTEKMQLSNVGKLGIGKTPDATHSLLTSGPISAESTTNPYVRAKYNTVITKVQSLASTGLVGTESDDNFGIYTSNSVKMTIDTDGEVGIGTTAPQTRLDLGGGTSGSGISWHTSSTLAYSSMWSSFSGARLTLARGMKPSTTVGNGFESSIATSIGRTAIELGADQINFYVEPAATVAYGTAISPDLAMRIDSVGKVGIGTAPTYRLHVVGDSDNQAHVVFNNQETSTPYGILMDFSAHSPDNNTQYFLRCDDSTAVRTYIYSDGDVWTSDAGTLTSDQTLKNSIVDATPKLDDLLQLRVRNFEWNASFHPNKVGQKKIGFIAQEVEQIFPSLVSEHNIARQGQTPVMKKAIKNAFTPMIIKAMQELNQKVETQSTIIAALEARLSALEGGA